MVNHILARKEESLTLYCRWGVVDIVAGVSADVKVDDSEIRLAG